MRGLATIGLDLAKNVFQAHGADADGAPLFNRKLRRSDVIGFFKKIPPCLVGLEACSTANYWAREIGACGHEVRVIPAQYVKPFVKRDKTDANDAEAICEAVTRRTMRFVPCRSLSQQAAIIVLRSRQLLVRQRAQLIIALRYHVAELGIIAPTGKWNLKVLIPIIRDDSDTRIPRSARDALVELLDQVEGLSARILKLDRQIAVEARDDADTQRLLSIPGVGSITAITIKAFVVDPTSFKSSRHFASWLGLTPGEHSSGGKQRRGGISKRGNSTLRSLLVLGAAAVLRHIRKRGTGPAWLQNLMARRPFMVSCVALANKMARVVWALLTKGGMYRSQPALELEAATS